MGLAYFPFYPKDWLADTSVAQLTLEEQGAYFKLLCHLWQAKDGACTLPNDDRVLSLILGVRIDVWRRLSKKLKTVLTFADKFVTSERLRDIREKSDKKLTKVPEKSGESPTKTPSSGDFSGRESRDLKGLEGTDPPYSSYPSPKSSSKLPTTTSSPVVEQPTPVDPGSGEPLALLSQSPLWPPDLEVVRAALVKLEAPEDLHDPPYWRGIDEWLAKHPTVAYLDELAKYLTWWRAQTGRKRHKKLKAGFRSWLSTSEGQAERAAQRQHQYQQRPNEYPGAGRR